MVTVLTAAEAFAQGPTVPGALGNQYVSGIEGLKAGTLPPPGFYWRMYGVHYKADELMDSRGKDSPVGIDVDTFALANRFLWVTSFPCLGADFAASVVVPVIRTDLSLDIPGPGGMVIGVEDDQSGMGDVCVDFFNLEWRRPRYDAGFGVSVIAPTGDYKADEPASPGKDMWTGMLTLAGTYYMDSDKSWSASILARYEKHSEQDDLDVTFGDDFHFEWGIGKSVMRGLDIGLSGYCQWQITDDEGMDVAWNPGIHDRVFAAGPEVVGYIPPLTMLVSLRTQWEFEAKDRPKGNSTALVLTKIF